MATAFIQALGVHSLTAPVTVTASVVNITKTLLDSQALQSGQMDRVGITLNMRAKGLITTSAVPVTYNVTVEYGTTVLCSTGVFTPIALMTSMLWTLDCDITTASSGNVEAQGVFNYYSTVATLNPQAMKNAATVAVTTTGIVTPRIAITFGGNTAGNNLVIRTDAWCLEGQIP